MLNLHRDKEYSCWDFTHHRCVLALYLNTLSSKKKEQKKTLGHITRVYFIQQVLCSYKLNYFYELFLCTFSPIFCLYPIQKDNDDQLMQAKKPLLLFFPDGCPGYPPRLVLAR